MIQILHFTDCFAEQSFHKEASVHDIDLRELPGTNGYCDDEAAEVIFKAVADYMTDTEKWESGRPLTWIGNGNYHYVAWILSNFVTQPFSLVVLDHHPDAQASLFGDILSCGSWVLRALNSPLVQEVVLIGVKDELLEVLNDLTEKPIYCMPESEIAKLDTEDGHTIMEQIEGHLHYPVYLSIDKDVLRSEDCVTNWDSGSMTLEQMLEFCRELLASHEVLGADVCGEAEQQLTEQELQTNNTCNRELLQLLR